MSDINETKNTLEEIKKLLGEIDSANNNASESFNKTTEAINKLNNAYKSNPAITAKLEAEALEKQAKSLDKIYAKKKKLADLEFEVYKRKKEKDASIAKDIEDNRHNNKMKQKEAQYIYDTSLINKKRNKPITEESVHGFFKELIYYYARKKSGPNASDDKISSNYKHLNSNLTRFSILIGTTIAVFKKLNKIVDETNNKLNNSTLLANNLGIQSSKHSNQNIKKDISDRASISFDIFKSAFGNFFAQSKAGLQLTAIEILEHSGLNILSKTLKNEVPYIESDFTKLGKSIESVTSSLNNFEQSIATGMGTNSKNEMIGDAALLASKIAVDKLFNLSSDEALTQIQAAMQGKNNSLGISTDSATFAGWAQSKGVDVVNVDITEEKKQQMMLEMIKEQYDNIKRSGKGSAQELIKQWKTVGNVMEKTKNQVLSFDEVINLNAFDPEIPSYTEIDDMTDAMEKANNQVIVLDEYGRLTFQNLQDYLKETEGSFEELITVIDNQGNTVMMSLDAYNLWKEQVKENTVSVERGFEGLCDTIIKQGATSADEIGNICAQLGLTEEEIKSVVSYLNKEYKLELDASEVIEEANNVKNNMKETEKSVDNMNESIDKAEGKTKSWLDNFEFSLSNILKLIWDIVSTPLFDVNTGNNAFNKALKSAGTSFSLASGPFGFGLNSIKWAYNQFTGHADGGISTNAHLANISENNKKEAIIPLESSLGINALSEAMIQASANGGQGGDTYNINLHLDGINIADNDEKWLEVASKIEEYIRINRNRRGDLSYGLV